MRQGKMTISEHRDKLAVEYGRLWHAVRALMEIEDDEGCGFYNSDEWCRANNRLRRMVGIYDGYE